MIDTITSPDASPLFTEDEKAAVNVALELTKTVAVSDATFERARKCFDERQLVELVMAVGIANMNNRISDAFWADPPAQPSE